MMNLYPYNAGHLLILPYRHIAQISDMSVEERAEFFEVVSHAVTIVTKVVDAHGANVGMNLGKAAGAGIPDHLHLHIVPRWVGDSNFLPVIGKTKQISVDLFALYGRLVEAF
jgi:ATP adenylyltransferase